MSNRTNLRTPLILRTGFLHDYKITALVVVLVYLSSFILVWPANLVYVWLSRGLIDFFFIIGLCMFGTWVSRAVVAGFDEFFDAFDKKTESLLSMYFGYSVRNRFKKKPIKNKRRAAIQAGVQNQFYSKKAYQKFQDGIREILFPTRWGKADITLILVALIFLVLFTIIWSVGFGPKYFSYAGFTVWPWTHIHALYVTLMNIFWFLIGFSALGLILSYLRAIWLLDSSRNNLVIWKHIQNLQRKTLYPTNLKLSSKPIQKLAINWNRKMDTPFMSYPRFYHITARIGLHTAWVTVAVITVVLIQIVRMAVVLEWLWYGSVTWVSLALSIFMIPSSIIIFLVPQREIHEFLMDTKYCLLNGWRRIYDEKLLRFFQLFQNKQNHNPSDRSEKDFLKYKQEIETIQNIIIETSLERDWTVGVPATVGISTISVIPTIITVSQTFFPFWQ